MSLRMRWFLVVGSLVALLVAAQGWWVRQLAADLSDEEERVAVMLGESMAHLFLAEVPGHETQVHVIDMSTAHMDPTAVLRSKAEISFENGATFEHHDQHRDVRTVVECHEGECLEKRYEQGDVVERQIPQEEVAARYSGGVAYREFFRGSKDKAPDDAVHSAFSFRLENEAGARFLQMKGPNIEHRVGLPQSAIEERLDGFRRHMLLGSLGILAFGLLLAAYLAHRVARPLQHLAASARRVGEGDWGNQVDVRGSGEIAQAISAFNHMSQSLADLDAKNRELGARQHLGEIGEIARGLAHSLRNPLNALGLSVDELAARSSGAEVGASDDTLALADAARKQIRRIDQSIRSFLALASQGGGVVRSVEMRQLVDDVALEALQDSRGRVRLEVEQGDEGTLAIDGVEPELRAVVQALLVNAIEASPEGGQVTVRLDRHDATLRIHIDDQGPGLPPEVRQRLFTPHLSTKANGSGMGLFLAQRIACNRYGGRLELHDLDPHGTRVELSLQDRVDGDTDR